MLASKWIKIAGTFPPTLNKVNDPAYLKENESPAATGLDCNKPTYLAAGTVPTGTARIAKTYTIGATTYYWMYNRLWRWASTQLTYGAPEYKAIFYPQGLGSIDFLEDAQNILTVIPFGGALAVLKSTGGYVISNATSQDANFVKSDIIQEIAIDSAANAVELDGIVYVCNTTGLYAVAPNGEVVELTQPLRTSIAPFASAALTADYQKKWIIGGSSFVYDVNNKLFFDYSSAAFSYTSPTLIQRKRGMEAVPFSVDAVAIEYAFGSVAEGSVTLETNVGGRGWGEPQTIKFDAEDDTRDRVMCQLENPRNGRSFALRLTNLSSNVLIKNIYVSAADYKLEGLSE